MVQWLPSFVKISLNDQPGWTRVGSWAGNALVDDWPSPLSTDFIVFKQSDIIRNVVKHL